ERFAGFLWNSAVKANFKTKVSGTTTFGYHPYWCFQYNGATRTYQGWSYSDHCGGNYDYLAGASGPPPPVCGNGVQEAGEECDLGANNGKMGYCCNIGCKFNAAGSVCRQTNGDCDKAETCSGSSATCPSDGWENSGSTACSVDADCASLSNDP